MNITVELPACFREVPEYMADERAYVVHDNGVIYDMPRADSTIITPAYKPWRFPSNRLKAGHRWDNDALIYCICGSVSFELRMPEPVLTYTCQRCGRMTSQDLRG